jgi:hypothetical protein
MTVRVQGGWIEATIRDRGRPIPHLAYSFLRHAGLSVS